MKIEINIIDSKQLKKFAVNSEELFDYLLKNSKGIYLLWNNNKVVYVGKSNSIPYRLISHELIVKKENNITSVSVLPTISNFEMDIGEIIYIHKLKPKYNKQNKYLKEEFKSEIYI